jgi:hypothetical protein
MGIGGSILLLAAGAIVLFALDVATPGWVDLDLVGWILVGAGALGLIVALALASRRAGAPPEPTYQDGEPRLP